MGAVMGIRNVNAAFAYWSHLPDRPFRVLVRMCQIANDDTRTYYGGQEMLAQGIGLDVPEMPHEDQATPEERDRIHKVREDAFRKVRRGMQTLTDAGVVSLLNTPRVGVRANYAINAHNPPEQVKKRPPRVVDDKKEQVTERPTEQVTEWSGSRSLDGQGGGHSVTSQPLRNQDQPEPHQEISPTNSSTDRACEPNGMDEMSPFQAAQILTAASKTGTNVVALIDSAPASCTTKAKKRIWAARQLLAQEAS